MKLGEAIAKLLEKVGLDVTAEEYKPVLSVTQEIPDEAFTKIDTELVTLAAAKSNGQVKKEILGQFISGSDKNLTETLQGLGFTKEQIDDVYTEKNFSDRFGKAIKKLSEIKDESSKKGDDKTLKDQIATLNKELATYKENFVPKDEVEKLKLQIENEKVDYLKSELVNSQKWNEAYADKSIRKAAFDIKLNESLNKLNAKLVRTEEGLKIVDKESGADIFDSSSKLLTLDNVTASIMAENNFISVSNQNANQQTTVVTGNQSGSQGKKSNVLKLLDESLENFQKA